jgi:phosphoglycolate phosphatase
VNTVNAFIIDLDGTLVDTLGDFELALNRMLRDVSLGSISRAEIEPLVGKGAQHLVRAVLALKSQSATGSHTLGPGYVEMAAQTAYQKHYRAINGQASSLYPGAREGLQLLRETGRPMACLTNKPLDAARELLQRKNLLGFFDYVFGGDSFERKKPDPLPLLKTCEALGSAPANTLMVGDSSNDAQAARAAGCPVLLMTYGYNHGEPVDAVDCDGLLASLAQVPEWLAGARSTWV